MSSERPGHAGAKARDSEGSGVLALRRVSGVLGPGQESPTRFAYGTCLVGEGGGRRLMIVNAEGEAAKRWERELKMTEERL